MAGQLFTDIYEVTKLNPEGKKFERVDRLTCKGSTYDVDLYMDIASEVCKLREGDKFTLMLASTLRLDGKPDSDYYEPDGKESLLDRYDYGMCGRVFKYEYSEAERKVSVVASFGGLLLMLHGEQKHLLKVQLDAKIYALIKVVSAK